MIGKNRLFKIKKWDDIAIKVIAIHNRFANDKRKENSKRKNKEYYDISKLHIYDWTILYYNSTVFC
jgi:hypothetical protein